MGFPHVETNTDITESGHLLEWVWANVDQLKERLDRDGAILFRGFPVTSPELFDEFSAAFGYGDFTYAESLSNAVRINLTRRVFTANEAPPDVEIFLHHEMAQTPVYPQKIFFYCQSAALTGGATPVCRSDHLFQALLEQAPESAAKFAELGLKYTTHMPAGDDLASGQGRSWHSTLSVETKPEAEARLHELGYTWTWLADGSLEATTPALPAVRELADGTETFFNQVIAVHCGWKRRAGSERPVMTFGNDEPIDAAMLDKVVALARELTLPLEWQEGDVALIDNYRVMHGRYPYSGDRKRQVLVCLAKD
jgi:alpha-ketoglutarate-dependent taurine dioxygenase